MSAPQVTAIAGEIVYAHRGRYHPPEPGDVITLHGVRYRLISRDAFTDRWTVEAVQGSTQTL